MVLDKGSIAELAEYLVKYKKVTITNLCVLELKENETKRYYNVSKEKMMNAPTYRVNIKKARYLKDEIQRQMRKKK